MDIKEELLGLPKHWGFVAVQNKRPYQNDWQNNPLTRSQLFKVSYGYYLLKIHLPDITLNTWDSFFLSDHQHFL